MYSTTSTYCYFFHCLFLPDTVFLCRSRGIAFVVTFNKVFVNNVSRYVLVVASCSLFPCASHFVTPHSRTGYITYTLLQTGSHQLGASTLELDKLRCVFGDALEMQGGWGGDSFKRDSVEGLPSTVQLPLSAPPSYFCLCCHSSEPCPYVHKPHQPCPFHNKG